MTEYDCRESEDDFGSVKQDEIEQSSVKRVISSDVIQATQVLIEAVLRLIEADPHQWTSRPCPTCRSVSAIVNRPFGCSRKANG